MPKVERPVGGVLELSSVTSLYLFNASSIPPYCYVFYSHILTPFQHGGRCSAAVSNAYGDRRTMCMTARRRGGCGRPKREEYIHQVTPYNNNYLINTV